MNIEFILVCIVCLSVCILIHICIYKKLKLKLNEGRVKVDEFDKSCEAEMWGRNENLRI